jgi:hypothetical protein
MRDERKAKARRKMRRRFSVLRSPFSVPKSGDER